MVKIFTKDVDIYSNNPSDNTTVGYNANVPNPSATTIKIKDKKQDPLEDKDAATIIGAFEGMSVNDSNEEAALVTHYKDVRSTRVFSQRVQEQMKYYPGVHNTSVSQGENPFYTNAKKMGDSRMNTWDAALTSPDAFMGALRATEHDFSYKDVLDSDISAKERANRIGHIIAQCVPCFDRLLDLDGLVPDGDLLEVHLLNIRLRTDILDKILELFRSPGMFVDICELLKLLSRLCPQDLLALLAVLTQYLTKINLEFKFNLDFILNLVGPILSPFLDALSQWLDKWIQMILAPIICVTDHINEVVYMLNNIRLSGKNASASIDGVISADTFVSNPLDRSSLSGGSLGIDTGSTVTGKAWAQGEVDRFDTPKDTQYREYQPSLPNQEAEYAQEFNTEGKEIKEAWKPRLTEAERAERNKQTIDLENRQEKGSKTLEKLPGINREPPSDGTRWSIDKDQLSGKSNVDSFSAGAKNHPVEKQVTPDTGIKYFDPSPLVSSIVQLRDILQVAIRYMQDWFNYAVQMIYDLLGVDFGWLQHKGDSSMIKCKLIQLILMLKALLEAIYKNGLKCGIKNNLDVPQMKYILEDGLNSVNSTTKFKVADNGDITVITPSSDGIMVDLPSVEEAQSKIDDLSNSTKNSTDDSAQGKLNEEIRKKSKESGIIIKNCLQDMSQQEVDQARQWIADYERRLGQNA
jgi:hypothetical protein